jgi:16S rRNA (adenine1518-N6/adenine1519-N6)-dimethyltransferase
MRRLLDERGLKLTRSLGQNFLHDGNQLRRIVDAAELRSSDQVLEIGPGLGPLTELLVASGCPLLSIELDRRLVTILERQFRVPAVSAAAGVVRQSPPEVPVAKPSPEVAAAAAVRVEERPAATASGPAANSGGNSASAAIRSAHPLTLLHADALVWLKKNPRDWAGWKLVANLPYSVGSPILVELAETDQPPDRMVVTLQLEVVKRLLARPDTEDYGLLTLLLQLRYETAGWFKIPANCFFPQPNVDSACITLIRRPKPLLTPAEATRFTRLVKIAFGQRRKMMFKLLTAAWPEAQLETAFGAVGLEKTKRAEQVGLEQFVRLTRQLSAQA